MNSVPHGWNNKEVAAAPFFSSVIPSLAQQGGEKSAATHR